MKKTTKKASYKILSIDPFLKPYESDIELRMKRHADTRQRLLGDKADLVSFANGYLYYGFHRTEDGWVFREWAPGADEIHLIGDFNNWNRTSHPLTRLEGGVWEIAIPSADAIAHNSRVLIEIAHDGKRFDRIPSYIHATRQNPETLRFEGVVWEPEAPFRWTDGGYKKHKPSPMLIYEAHVGMAQEREGIGTYREFADNVLPRIQALGYNTIQLMAIMEHPYYASFGYQVSNFFAASSWYGTPDDLKYLVNRAHEMGIYVLLDMVHSHACKNVGEGLNLFDGTSDQYFMPDDHPAWGSRLFNYGKHEVIHFLLSNLKYWIEEYHFDGFRFDGVTSMLYHNHGLGESFTSYRQYFSLNTNVEAVTYLQLANELVHAVNPFAITIAEDMSGMPGMCVPIRYGGIGFDYRLSMGIPDYWIRLVKDTPDQDWDLYRLWYELTTRRPQEKNVGYTESHDQALVGDKTLMFRMADAEMYTGMAKEYHSIAIDRAIALHKMIRFITLTLGSDAYLNFMGNEFGHPEWIDFPREGNGWSYQYARRQWSLADSPFLKYSWLNQFDRDMLKFVRRYRVLSKPTAMNLWIDQEKKLLAFAKGDMIYVFNFSASCSPTDFFVPAHATGEGAYRALFTTDDAEYGGQDRVDRKYVYHTKAVPEKGVGFAAYIPSRTAIVFQRVKA